MQTYKHLVNTLAVALVLSLAGCNQTSEAQQICIEAFEHQRDCGVEVPDSECPAEPSTSEMCIYECVTPDTVCEDFFNQSSLFYACLQGCL